MTRYLRCKTGNTSPDLRQGPSCRAIWAHQRNGALRDVHFYTLRLIIADFPLARVEIQFDPRAMWSSAPL